MTDLVIIDIEATGLESKSVPIEIAWVCGKSNEHDSFLINPESANWDHWTLEAEMIHGIPRGRCIKDGISIYEAVNRLNSQLRGCIVLSDAAPFDFNWLKQLFNAAKTEMDFSIMGIDQFLELTKQSHEKIYNFHKAKFSKSIPHRALADCRLIKKSLISAKIIHNNNE
ncbi:3'-5' exonuclease [Photobacterium leiognathi]|uniref:3'-5' exonuclease n=1 Tax=Photobacterium leiognathi TaxID=553611 RepID=UPI002980EF6E|nr:3'-5' exonuclease [Photobacterium leiognathi]